MAYQDLVFQFNKMKYPEECLVYSLIMVNKYKYKPALFYVYYSLTQAYENHKITIDKTSKEIALKYLKRGADLNEFQSVREFWKLYEDGKYVPKDTVLSKKFEERLNKMQ